MAALSFIGIPAIAVTVIIFNTRVELRPCSVLGITSPPNCTAHGTVTSSSVCLANPEGVSEGDTAYCEHAPLGYFTTLLMVHAFLPYCFTYAISLPLLVTGSTIGSLIGIVALLWVDLLSTERFFLEDGERGFASIGGVEWARLLVLVSFAHAIGVAHHVARSADVVEASALRLRQQRLLRQTREEIERCEKLLANIVPPGTPHHAIISLKRHHLTETPSSH